MTFHLNLTKKWFDMIYNGEKTEEYRDIKPYWYSRLWGLFPQNVRNVVYDPIIETITFSNGYQKKRKQFEIEFKGIQKAKGKEQWGAIKGKDYYVLQLGKIINNNFQH